MTESCPICLEDIVGKYFITKCKHKFHKKLYR